MQIHGFNKTTLLDYPKHLAACVFTGACNLRCPFCQNASLVLRPSSQLVIPVEEVLTYLKKRVGILEGICITGGEPTLQPDLAEFMTAVHELGLKVKLDTNGYQPDVLHELLERNLVDYVAMDIKSSKKNYAKAAGVPELDIRRIEESVQLLREKEREDLDYEFRTTAVRELICKEDFLSIGDWLHEGKAYYLQGFQDSGDLIGDGLSGYSRLELEEIREQLLLHFEMVEIRGVDEIYNK